jgi:hypothetical protein
MQLRIIETRHRLRRIVTSAVLAVCGMLAMGAAEPGHGAESAAEASLGQATDLVPRALTLMGGAEEIVFAVRDLYSDGHYYANFGHWALNPAEMMYGPDGGQLCKLNLRTGELGVLLDDAKGSVRDPQVHYDGRKILFSYRPGGMKYFHLYEIGADGTGLRQLTDGPFDDIEPSYLPDGDIVFPSSRCKRFVACWYTPVATLHRMDPDGGHIRSLSSNIVHENTPAVLGDGRVMYTRWEYVDRAPQKFHGLWSMNPDGTNQRIIFGNTQPPGEWILMIDARPIPGSDKLVAIFSPHHGNREHAGHVTIVDPNAGPDASDRARRISPNVKMENGWMGGRDGFRDPCPLSEDCFLTARDKSLFILDGQGRTQEIYRGKKMVHEPWVLRPRPREQLLAPRSQAAESTGRLVVSDVHHGRNMQGVQPGAIRELLVLEQLPKPVAFSGVQQTISMNGTHTLKRILGTVPVEADGSAYLEVPALRSLYFVALDAHGRTVKRMQSFYTVMPGETVGCVGCHEHRTETPKFRPLPLATLRPPSQIEPLPNVPDVIDYPRDVQPILDRRCVECHRPEKPEGRVVLTGDYNEWFTQSYFTLFSSDLVRDSQGYDEDGNHPARGFGSTASRLMPLLDGSHYQVKLPPAEQQLVQLWIDTGATYPVTFGTVRTGAVRAGGESVDGIIKRRCLTCHDAKLPLGPRIHKTQTFLNVPQYCLNLYNLTHPEKSMILLAPLAKESGGYGWCQTRTEPRQPAQVFRDAQDSDYQVILQAIRVAKEELHQLKRFDMPGFQPNRHYVRELQRYGVLPAGLDPTRDTVDVYATDRAYWRSLWYQPTAVTKDAAAEGSHE